MIVFGAGPTIWNSLPETVCAVTNKTAFKRILRTQFFNMALILRQLLWHFNASSVWLFVDGVLNTLLLLLLLLLLDNWDLSGGHFFFHPCVRKSIFANIALNTATACGLSWTYCKVCELMNFMQCLLQSICSHLFSQLFHIIYTVCLHALHQTVYEFVWSREC